MKYVVDAKTSNDSKDNYISFYKEDNKIWISIGRMEERGFTIEESKEILTKLSMCLEE